MSKTVTLMVLIVVGMGSTTSAFGTHPKNLQQLDASLIRPHVGIDLCPKCINEVVDLITILANLILDEGIVQSCGSLCAALSNRTGSIVIGDLCIAACDSLGIDEFVHLLARIDIDPIYYCQLVKMCPINDNGDAKFTNFGVTPKTGPEGTTFVLDCSFRSINGTGMGTISFDIVDPKNITTSEIFWFEERKAGTYPERIGINTYALASCRSSEGPCNNVPVGNYTVTAYVCNGMCGSHHPHTSIYDTGKASFAVTKKQ